MKVQDVSPYPQVGQYWARPKPLSLLQVLEVGPHGEVNLREWNPRNELEIGYLNTEVFAEWVLLPFVTPVNQFAKTDVGDVWLLNDQLVFIGYNGDEVAAFSEKSFPFKEVAVSHARLIQPGPKSKTKSIWEHLDNS